MTMDETNDLLARFQPKETKLLSADPQVTLARYTPCGRQLVAASFDGRVRRWNVESDDVPELPALGGHQGWCTALAFRGGGELLFSADSWGEIRCWNYGAEAAEPKWRRAQAHDGWIRDLAVSPDGSLLASCGMDKKLRLWSCEDGRDKAEFAATGNDLFCIRFHPDGKSLFVGDDRGLIRQLALDGATIRDFDASALYTLSRLQDVGGVRCMTLDKEGKLLAVGGTTPANGGTVTGIPTAFIFDVATGEQKHKLQVGDPQDVNFVDLHLHEAGFLVAATCGTPGKGRFFYLRPEDKAPFFESKKVVNCQSLSLRPDGKQLALVGTNGGSNGNGRSLKDGKYPGNQSPIQLYSVPGA
jgi:WD40 repeat protein